MSSWQHCCYMVPGILFEEYFLIIFIFDWRLRKSSRYLYAPYVLFMWKEIIEYYHTRRMIQQCDLLIRYRQNVLDVNCMGDTPTCRRSGVDIPKKNCSFSMWIHANFLIAICMAIAIVFDFVLNKSEISMIYLLIIMTRFKPNSNNLRSGLADLE